MKTSNYKRSIIGLSFILLNFSANAQATNCTEWDILPSRSMGTLLSQDNSDTGICYAYTESHFNNWLYGNDYKISPLWVSFMTSSFSLNYSQKYKELNGGYDIEGSLLVNVRNALKYAVKYLGKEAICLDSGLSSSKSEINSWYQQSLKTDCNQETYPERIKCIVNKIPSLANYKNNSDFINLAVNYSKKIDNARVQEEIAKKDNDLNIQEIVYNVSQTRNYAPNDATIVNAPIYRRDPITGRILIISTVESGNDTIPHIEESWNVVNDFLKAGISSAKCAIENKKTNKDFTKINYSSNYGHFNYFDGHRLSKREFENIFNTSNRKTPIRMGYCFLEGSLEDTNCGGHAVIVVGQTFDRTKNQCVLKAVINSNGKQIDYLNRDHLIQNNKIGELIY